jgi:acetyl esterase/lipase
MPALSFIDSEHLKLVAEQRRFEAARAQLIADIAGMDADTPEGLTRMRALMAPGGPFCAPVVDSGIEREIAGPAGPIPIRIMMPEAVSAVYLSIHGGGFSIGTRSSNDTKNALIADQCGVVVVSPEYRLAPEHVYPAAQDDCEAVAAWLVENARHEFGTDRLMIGGESAGGHLAAATLLRMRDRHNAANRFAAANLDCGVYDLSRTPSQRLPNHPDSTLTSASLRVMAQRYAPDCDADAMRDADLSPLYADLRGLCPALFTVGEFDPLLDDSVFLATRWSLAGNHAELAVYPEGQHGVAGTPTALGRVALDRQVQFLALYAQA